MTLSQTHSHTHSLETYRCPPPHPSPPTHPHSKVTYTWPPPTSFTLALQVERLDRDVPCEVTLQKQGNKQALTHMSEWVSRSAFSTPVLACIIIGRFTKIALCTIDLTLWHTNCRENKHRSVSLHNEGRDEGGSFSQ